MTRTGRPILRPVRLPAGQWAFMMRIKWVVFRRPARAVIGRAVSEAAARGNTESDNR